MDTPSNIKLKYINLDHRKDRKEKFIKEMEKENIRNYERFSAVNGKKLELTEDIENMFKDNTFNWRGGIIGATLSHTTLWRELINETDPNVDYYLIFEDDITLDNNFKQVLNNVSNTIKKIKYPFIFLGYHTERQDLILPYDLSYDYNNDDNKSFIYPIVQKSHIWGGLFGYLIHKDCAKDFIDDIDNNGLKIPIDTYVLKYDKLFMLYPEIVKSEFMTFDNNVDSDIQYELTGLKDNYIFIPGKDSPNNDITVVNTHYFEVLKHVADITENCVAFNTLGYLKHSLVDPKDYIDLPHKSISGLHGLYIKKKK